MSSFQSGTGSSSVSCLPLSSSEINNMQAKEEGQPYSSYGASTQEDNENISNFDSINLAKLPSSQQSSLDYILAEFPLPKTPCVLEDTVMVPCTPIEPLFGLAFLSSAAYAELKCGSRKNVLLVDDEIELPLWYVKQLYFEGKIRMRFPDIYKQCQCLSNDACLSLQIGLLSPFFFEVGLFLANIVSPNEWPITNIRKVLAAAELQRWNFVLRFDENIQKKTTFFNGMTWKEYALYYELIRLHALNRHSGSTRGSLGGFGDFAVKDV